VLYRLQDVVVEFGERRLLGPLSLQHNPGEKLVLVGRNGAGKTTLLRLILGKLQPSAGSVVRASGLRLAYLEQLVEEAPTTPVLDFVLGAIPELLALEAERERLACELNTPEGMAAFAAVEEQLARLDAFRARPRAQALLNGFGIPQQLHQAPLGALSGGQRTRAALARVLMAPADLLLLDEPTNHLDLLGAVFLAQVLAEYRGALLLVTHDRALVDAVGGDILELSGGQLERYRGPFARYQKERQARREQQRRAWELQQQEIARQQEFVRRNIAGQNTRQAQARLKLLAKVELLQPPPPDPQPVKLRWPALARSGDRVLEVQGLAVGYQRPLLQNLHFALRRGERVALVGANGTGKTTLLKTLAGLLPPLAGSIKFGTGVSAGYLDQEQASVASGTPLELLLAARPHWTPAEARAWAGAFGFSGEAAETSTAVFSGGERSRLALALLLAQAPNLLLLDEPTNHLDIPTCQVLETVLQDFPGAVLFTSHDRAFVEQVATGVLLFAEGQLQPMHSPAEAFAAVGVEKPKAKEPGGKASRRSPQEEERRRLSQQVTKMEKGLAEVEQELEAVEQILGQLEATLALPEVMRNPEQLRTLADRLQATRARQEALWQRWCQMADEVEVLRRSLAQLSCN